MIKMTIADYVAFKQLKEEAAADGVALVLADVCSPAAVVAPPKASRPVMSRAQAEDWVDRNIVTKGKAEVGREDLMAQFGWDEAHMPVGNTSLRGVRVTLAKIMSDRGFQSVGNCDNTRYLKMSRLQSAPTAMAETF